MQQKSNFAEAYFKIERAGIHIDEFQRITDPVLCEDFYEITWRRDTNYPTGINFDVKPANTDYENQQLVYQPRMIIRAYLSLLLGDAIHNLRAALDYAATSVARKAGLSTKFLTFPFHENRNSLINSGPLGAIQTIFPSSDCVSFFRNEIEPCRDGNFDLWALTKLDKIDKHNMIIPTVAFSDIRMPEIVGLPENFSVSNARFRNGVDQPFALYQGYVSPNASVGKAEVTVDITFPTDGLYGGEPVLATLIKLRSAAYGALLKFDEFVTRAASLEKQA